MTRTSEKAAKPRENKDLNARLRRIPSVDELLGEPRLVALARSAGHAVVTQVARGVLRDLRARLIEDADSVTEIGATRQDAIVAQVASAVEAVLAPSLRPVINATGVILHTNLGRAPLARAASEAIGETAVRYSNLEYDIERGERGKRDVHTAGLLADLAGAEAAIVVNNNAAAVFLVLNTLAKGAEVIVSRGELIEIGDGFRIPDIMSESGATLREVGTTNRTRIRDYERAISTNTRLLLRVHPSNFRVTGFTERPFLDELVRLGRRKRLPVFEDLGSGCLADLTSAGITEPVVRASCRSGATLVSFSGDKLLGGPQAGIIVGKKQAVARIRRNPLFRALRVDKLTIAALEATLKAYYRGAVDEVPALRMIRMSADEIARRVEAFAQRITAALPPDAEIKRRPGFSVIGGGSTPDQKLPTHLILIKSRSRSASEIEQRLRRPQTGVPAVARIAGDQLILDLRTVFLDEEGALASALTAALAPS
jgi:L-seryl-tRNA(Ser) seleniumtransferase